MKRIPILVIGLMVLAVAPSYAGSFGVYGSYWDGSDPGSTYGAGARVGFDFAKWLELEFHGTYYADFSDDDSGVDIDLTALPVDGGLRINFLPKSKFNVYAGGGVTYYFMDTSLGSIDNEFTYYGEGGIEFGGDKTKFFAEALWRSLDTSINDSTGDTDVDFSGISLNVGVNWSW
jgi:hypothetical protein